MKIIFLLKYRSFVLGGAEKQTLLLYSFLSAFMETEILYINQNWKILSSCSGKLSIKDFMRMLLSDEKKILYIRNRGNLVVILMILKLLFKKFKILYWTAENYSCQKFIEGIGPKRFLEHFLFVKTLPYFDSIISQTYYQKKKYLQKFGLDSHLIRNVINGLDDQTLDASTLKEKYLNNSFVWIGKLDVRKKRFDELIKIAAKYTDINFKVVGPWKDITEGDQILYSLNLANFKIPSNIKIIGKLPLRDCEHYIKRAKFLISTSSDDGEGFPNTFLEAWKFGTPVFSLSFDPGGIIEKYELGFIKRFESCLELNLERYMAISRNCYDYCRKHHTISNFEKVKEILDEMDKCWS